MRTVPVALAVLLAVPLAGCSSSSAPNVDVCVQALDAADAGFNDFGNAITSFHYAIDEAFNGQLAQATNDVKAINMPSASRYKALEARCRQAAR